MADIYTRGAATAARLLTKYNQATYTLSRALPPIPAQNDWDQPTRLPPQTWTLQGISKSVDEQYVDGSVIKVTDRQVVVAAFDDEPKTGDVFSINGKVQTVLGIKKLTEMGLAWIIIIKG